MGWVWDRGIGLRHKFWIARRMCGVGRLVLTEPMDPAKEASELGLNVFRRD